MRCYCIPPLFLLISLDMGSDIWVRPLGPVAPQGVAWMHFANVAEALRDQRSADGGSLRIQHTQVARAAKANATRDGYAFTFEEPSSLVVASPPRSQRTPVAPAPNLSTFGFTSVRCACCGANICGTKYTCSRCHRVVDEACMQLVERLVQCFSCTCRACGNELPSHTVECHACHFRVHPTCTTDGVCTWCAAREPASPDLIPKPRKFSHAWQLTRPWLRYDPMCVLMWCEACRAHPQLGSSVPFVQGTSNFKLYTVKEHENSGTHNVSVALWQFGGRVTSVIRALPVKLQDGIMALFRIVYRIVQRYAPLTHLEGDADLIPLTGGTIVPSQLVYFKGFITIPAGITPNSVLHATVCGCYKLGNIPAQSTRQR